MNTVDFLRATNRLLPDKIVGIRNITKHKEGDSYQNCHVISDCLEYTA